MSSCQAVCELLPWQLAECLSLRVGVFQFHVHIHCGQNVHAFSARHDFLRVFHCIIDCLTQMDT